VVQQNVSITRTGLRAIKPYRIEFKELEIRSTSPSHCFCKENKNSKK